MKEGQIRAFLAAARTLNFTAAARELYITPQTVSKNIANLEKYLNTILFLRDVGTLHLTEAGQHYAQIFSNFTRSCDQIAQEAKSFYSQLERQLCVGISDWIDPMGGVLKGISGFRAQRGDVKVVLRSYRNTQLMQELSAGNLDVVLISGAQKPQENEFEMAPVAPEHICLFAPADIEGDKIDRKCWGLPFLQTYAWDRTYLEQKRAGRWELESAGLAPREVWNLPNFRSILAELNFHRSVAMIDTAFGHTRGLEHLRRFPMDFADPCLYCVWPRINESALVPEFVSCLQQLYGLEPSKAAE